jgi:drug/metabolite transporter (DMT)-like permease
MLCLFGVVAVARKELDALVGHGLVVLLAVLAAVFLAIGIVVRQRATMDVPQEHGVSSVMFITLLRRPLWWGGTAAAVAGYVFQALALANGSLLLVQPILVSALLFALPLSARLAHRHVTRGEWAWAVLLTVSLAVFVLLARARPGNYEASVALSALVALICTAAVTACVVVAIRTMGWRRAVLLAVAVGVLFGVVAVLTKLAMYLLTHEGAGALLTTPVPYLLAVLGVIAVFLQQSAFHAGSLQTSVPTMLVLEPVIAVVLGAVVLGEHLDVSRSARSRWRRPPSRLAVTRVPTRNSSRRLWRGGRRRRLLQTHGTQPRPGKERDRYTNQGEPDPPVRVGAEVQIHRVSACAFVPFPHKSWGEAGDGKDDTVNRQQRADDVADVEQMGKLAGHGCS